MGKTTYLPRFIVKVVGPNPVDIDAVGCWDVEDILDKYGIEKCVVYEQKMYVRCKR